MEALVSGISRRFAVAGVAVAAAAIAACESATAPRSGVQRIALGTIVSGSVAAGDSARLYAFSVTAGAKYIVYAAVTAGAIQLEVQDSARQNSYGTGAAGPSGLPIVENPALQFFSNASAARLLVVSGLPAGAAAQYQLLLYEENDAPESRPAAFAIGDTISGETIDPSNDVDVFTSVVQGGTDFVTVAEAPAVTGVGTLEVLVLDSTDFSPEAYAFIMPGGPASATTGRVHAATTRTYRFEFAAASGTGWPAFDGPYRFWTYAISRAPEHRAAAVPFNSVVADERFDRALDVDEFTFTAAVGTQVDGFVQAAVPAHLEIAAPSGTVLATAAAGSDTNLYARSTGPTTLAQAGSYVARVVADGELVADTGAYRLYLYLVNPKPESVPDSIGPGDTIAGEAIDLPGDIDEFRFVASAGQEFTAFLQARSGDATTLLQLDVVDADGTVLGSVQSTGTDTSLLGQVTPRVAMHTTGTHRLRVSGVPATGARNRGPYRVFLYKVNRQPENHADTLAPGDSVFNEAIDAPSDVDEYRVHVLDTVGVDLRIQLPDSAQGYITAQLVDSASALPLGNTGASGGGTGQTGSVILAPGTYIVRIDGARGPYQLWLYRFKLGPETAPDTIVVGDTVQGESIDVPGDIDVYHFFARAWHPINVMLQDMATSGSQGIQAVIYGSYPYPVMTVGSRPGATSLADHQTVRMDPPATGWYTVTVSAGSPETGPYRLAIVPVSTTPESVSPTLAIGDSVTAEAIDFPGDWDQYTVTATPGQTLTVLFGTNAPCCNLYPYVFVFDPVTGDTLASNVGQGQRLAGPFSVPSGGVVAVAVLEQTRRTLRECYDATCGGTFGYTGAYWLQVVAVNRAPETASATYVLGDTVSSEAVFPVGDIDEFTLTATPGAVLSAWYRLRADAVPAGSLMTMVVVDPATGAVLAGSGAAVSGSSPSFFGPGSFTVPASGTVVLRFMGYGPFGEGVGTAPYEFFVSSGP